MTAAAFQLKVQGLLHRNAPHHVVWTACHSTIIMVCIPVLLAALCRVVLWLWDQPSCTALVKHCLATAYGKLLFTAVWLGYTTDILLTCACQVWLLSSCRDLYCRGP